MCVRDFKPEGTEAHAPDHVEERVEYEQTLQQVEEHGLWEWRQDNESLLHDTVSGRSR